MSQTLSVLLTGASGQLGQELKHSRPPWVRLYALPHTALDIRNPDAVHLHVQSCRPQWIINAAAYTAVDRAEAEPEQAWAVNCDGARHLAEAARQIGARLLQISTDYIFTGAQTHPYPPLPPEAAERHTSQQPNVYGASKRAGERAVRETLGEHALILRTAWVYSRYGHNFVKTMLRLMDEREMISVVSDQIGSPTWAKGLAEAIWQALARNLTGIHHWTDAGVASWYDLACAIQEEAYALGQLKRTIAIRPIRTQDYPTPAKRPAWSVLDKTPTWRALGIDTPKHWRLQLRAMLRELTLPSVHG
ncbi:MAG: dTDP-4-dehydrorhamnose reductase [Gammaproteobacteria bacterium]|nr:dTDP-4-dehydrorhamnose reductase [Gammaproteobacteria bacterium]